MEEEVLSSTNALFAGGMMFSNASPNLTDLKPVQLNATELLKVEPSVFDKMDIDNHNVTVANSSDHDILEPKSLSDVTVAETLEISDTNSAKTGIYESESIPCESITENSLTNDSVCTENVNADSVPSDSLPDSSEDTSYIHEEVKSTDISHQATPGMSRYGRVRRPKLSADFVSLDKKALAVLNSSSYDMVHARKAEAPKTLVEKKKRSYIRKSSVLLKNNSEAIVSSDSQQKSKEENQHANENLDSSRTEASITNSDVHSLDESSISSLNSSIIKTYSRKSEASVSSEDRTCANEESSSKDDILINHTELNWKVGDVAWAKIGCYPYWPSIVTIEYGSSIYVKSVGNRGNRLAVHVQFFGDRGRRSWVLTTSLIKYESKDQFLKLKRQYSKDKLKFKYFNIIRTKELWEKAIIEADTILKLPHDERIQYYHSIYPISEEIYAAEITINNVKRIRKRKNPEERRGRKRKILDGRENIASLMKRKRLEKSIRSKTLAKGYQLNSKKRREPMEEHLRKRKAFERRLNKLMKQSILNEKAKTNVKNGIKSQNPQDHKFERLLKCQKSEKSAKVKTSVTDATAQPEKKDALSVYDFESDEETDIFLGTYNSRFTPHILSKIESRTSDDLSDPPKANGDAEKSSIKRKLLDEKNDVEGKRLKKDIDDANVELNTKNNLNEDESCVEIKPKRGRGRPKGSKNMKTLLLLEKMKKRARFLGRRTQAKLHLQQRKRAGLNSERKLFSKTSASETNDSNDSVSEQKKKVHPKKRLLEKSRRNEKNSKVNAENVDENSIPVSDENDKSNKRSPSMSPKQEPDSDDEDLKAIRGRSLSPQTLPICRSKKSSNLFAGFKFEKVCLVCEKPGDTVRCRGPCSGTYHMECAVLASNAEANEAESVVPFKPRRGRRPRASSVILVSANESDEVKSTVEDAATGFGTSQSETKAAASKVAVDDAGDENGGSLSSAEDDVTKAVESTFDGEAVDSSLPPNVDTPTANELNSCSGVTVGSNNDETDLESGSMENTVATENNNTSDASSNVANVNGTDRSTDDITSLSADRTDSEIDIKTGEELPPVVMNGHCNISESCGASIDDGVAVKSIGNSGTQNEVKSEIIYEDTKCEIEEQLESLFAMANYQCEEKPIKAVENEEKPEGYNANANDAESEKENESKDSLNDVNKNTTNTEKCDSEISLAMTSNTVEEMSCSSVTIEKSEIEVEDERSNVDTNDRAVKKDGEDETSSSYTDIVKTDSISELIVTAAENEEVGSSDASSENLSCSIKTDLSNGVDFRCLKCTENKMYPCFTCDKEVQEKTGESARYCCYMGSCGRVYHKECLKSWPQTTWKETNSSRLVRNGSSMSKNAVISKETLICPQHYCHTCISENPAALKNKHTTEMLARCIRCPTAYHRRVHCIPAGTEILTMSQLICPRHYEPPVGAKNTVHFNTSWCFICCVGGSLICCDECPMSFHAECLKLEPEEYAGRYVCDDCQSGRYLLYGEIAWIKLGHYRWWPARILYPNEVPENIQNLPHKRGEFVVQFYGSHDYNWVNRGRAFVYQDGDSSKKSCGRSAVDVSFDKAIQEAEESYAKLKIAKEARHEEARISMKPPKYVHIKANKPVGNVRIVELNTSNITACECDPKSERPCGPDADCINRMLLVECNPLICPAGDRCNNQAFEKRIYPPLMPYNTDKRGWGLKTLVDMKKSDFIIEYVGEMIDEEEYQRRVKIMHKNQEDNYYFLTIDKDRMLDAGPKGNVSRFMNHSCDPNCETQKWTVNGDTRVGLFAVKDIPADAELVFNYNLSTQGNEKKPCYCGSEKCSGFIGIKAVKNADDETRKRSNEDSEIEAPKKVRGRGRPRKLVKARRHHLVATATSGRGDEQRLPSGLRRGRGRPRKTAPAPFGKWRVGEARFKSSKMRTRVGAVAKNVESLLKHRELLKQRTTKVRPQGGEENGGDGQKRLPVEKREERRGRKKIPRKEEEKQAQLFEMMRKRIQRKIEEMTFCKLDEKCFACGEANDSDDLLFCDNNKCPKGYHLRCLNMTKWPSGRWLCPWHYCTVCKSIRKVSKCDKCTNSFCFLHVSGNLSKDNDNRYLCNEHQLKSVNPPKPMFPKEIKVEVADTAEPAAEEVASTTNTSVASIATATPTVKRSRGRPKGSLNRPKLAVNSIKSPTIDGGSDGDGRITSSRGRKVKLKKRMKEMVKRKRMLNDKRAKLQQTREAALIRKSAENVPKEGIVVGAEEQLAGSADKCADGDANAEFSGASTAPTSKRSVEKPSSMTPTTANNQETGADSDESFSYVSSEEMIVEETAENTSVEQSELSAVDDAPPKTGGTSSSDDEYDDVEVEVIHAEDST